MVKCKIDNSSITNHIIDCSLVSLIAAGTSFLATDEVTTKIIVFSLIGGLIAGAIKMREYLNSGKRGAGFLVIG